jgi:hypothetical protein
VGSLKLLLSGLSGAEETREHQEYRKFVCGQRHAVGIASEPSAKRTGELCELNGNQLRQQQELMGFWH